MIKNHNIKCNCKLAEMMRAGCPLPGTNYRKMIMVSMEKGDSIAEHSHKGGTVLYYPMDSSIIQFEPSAGTIIYLPPGVKHTVPPVLSDRISFAMIIDPPY